MREDILKQVEQKYGKAYANALKFTMNAEGLYANNASDKGKMTYKGVARAFNGSWQGWKFIDKALEQFPELQIPFRKPPVSIDRLNKVLSENTELDMLVYDFYYENYWKRSGAERIAQTSEKASIIIFDISVISGVKRSGKTLQRLLNRYYGQGLLIDGILGSKTYEVFVEAYKKDGNDNIINHLILEYIDNMNEASKLSGNEVFLNGWLQRCTNLRNYLRLL